MSAFTFIMELPHPQEEMLDDVLVKCGPLLMFVAVTLGFFRINIKNYNTYVLIIVPAIFLGFNMMILGMQLEMLRKPEGQILAPGRLLEHIFIVFPFFALMSLNCWAHSVKTE